MVYYATRTECRLSLHMYCITCKPSGCILPSDLKSGNDVPRFLNLLDMLFVSLILAAVFINGIWEINIIQYLTFKLTLLMQYFDMCLNDELHTGSYLCYICSLSVFCWTWHFIIKTVSNSTCISTTKFDLLRSWHYKYCRMSVFIRC